MRTPNESKAKAWFEFDDAPLDDESAEDITSQLNSSNESAYGSDSKRQNTVPLPKSKPGPEQNCVSTAPNTHQIETRILEQTREIDTRLQRQEEKFTKLFQDERDKDQIKREDARDKEQLTRKDANKNAREAVEKKRFDKLHLEMKDLKTSIVERDKADELKELRKANARLVECLQKGSAGGPSRSLIIVLLNL